jgi:hypothetical protein
VRQVVMPAGGEARRSTAEEQRVARERIQHVIVVMLENRSYDHLLGFADHPAIPNLDPTAYPNPLDLDGWLDAEGPTGDPVLATSDGTPHLPVDPPHGHLAALRQLHRDRRGARMDGFVGAYAEKLAGHEHLPVVHWTAIRVAAAVLALPAAGAAHDLAVRAVDGGAAAWARLALLTAGAYVVVALGAHLLRVAEIPAIRRSSIRTVQATVALLLASTGSGWWRWATHGWRGVASWSIAFLVLGQGAITLVRQRRTVRPSVPARRLAEVSRQVMRCLPPAQVPVLTTLSTRYATCTRWHSSVPGATWPNRNFVHAATSSESVDIDIGFYEEPTIFELLDRQHDHDPRTWRIYHHDIPQVIAFPNLWRSERERRRWFDASRLVEHIAGDDLPMYAFVEPCHTGGMSNSQHPGNNTAPGAVDFERGEDLLHAIHECLVAHPAMFEKTLLVVTYDEHGGLFDHVPPPATVHPAEDPRVRRKELARRLVAHFVENVNRPFDFRTLGVRVPTIVISPWVAAGGADDTLYDHTSIVASLRLLFAPEQPPLTRRDAGASDLLHLLGGSLDRRPAPFPESYRRGPDPIGLAPGAAASRRSGIEPVARHRDDLPVQLDRLDDLVRRSLLSAPAPAQGLAPPVAVSTAELFKASADAARRP